jgi:hypothetical protein
MRKSFITMLAIGAISLLPAQSTADAENRAAAARDRDQREMTGVLLDASCPAIDSQETRQPGQRSRTSDDPGGSSAGRTVTTVREKYAECKVTPSSTVFALHAEGELYILDQASNAIVRRQMRNEAFQAGMVDESGEPRWMTVTVQGFAAADGSLSIRSVRK